MRLKTWHLVVLLFLVVWTGLVFGAKVYEGFQGKPKKPALPTLDSKRFGKEIAQKKLAPIAESTSGKPSLPYCETLCPKSCNPLTNDCRESKCLRNFRESKCIEDKGPLCPILGGQIKGVSSNPKKDMYQCPIGKWGTDSSCDIDRKTTLFADKRACQDCNVSDTNIQSGTWGPGNAYTFSCKPGFSSAATSVTCGSNGTLKNSTGNTVTAPFCKTSTTGKICQKDTIFNNSNLQNINRSNLQGDVTFSCSPGFISSISSNSVTCNKTTGQYEDSDRNVVNSTLCITSTPCTCENPAENPIVKTKSAGGVTKNIIMSQPCLKDGKTYYCPFQPITDSDLTSDFALTNVANYVF